MDDARRRRPSATGRGSIVSTVLGVLTVLVLVVTVVAVWARATVLNGDKLATIVGHALDEPEVQAGLADRHHHRGRPRRPTLQTRHRHRHLPDQLQRFAPSITAGAPAGGRTGAHRRARQRAGQRHGRDARRAGPQAGAQVAGR